MTTKTIALTSLAALMTLALACGDSETTTGDTNGSGGAGNSATGGNNNTGGTDTGGGGNANQCAEPEPAHAGQMAAVDGITATFIDQDGMPAAGVQTTVCGTNICSTPADSDASGMVAVDASSIMMFSDPRFNAGHNGLLYAKLSGPIPTIPAHDFGTVRVIRLDDFPMGVEFSPGGTVTQNGVSLTLAADADIKHSLVDYPEEEQRVFRGAVVDISAWPASEKPQVDATLGIDTLVVAMPLGSAVCPGADMSFDNVTGLAAGAEVDIYLNGSKTFKHYAPYGEWAKVSEGVVSADGTTIDTKEGMGIESLGTFGIAPK